MAGLFDEFLLKDVVLRNRIAVSPMCQSPEASTRDERPRPCTDSGCLRNGSPAILGGRLRVAGTAFRPRLPRSPVLLAPGQPPNGRLRRHVLAEQVVTGLSYELGKIFGRVSEHRPGVPVLVFFDLAFDFPSFHGPLLCFAVDPLDR